MVTATNVVRMMTVLAAKKCGSPDGPFHCYCPTEKPKDCDGICKECCGDIDCTGDKGCIDGIYACPSGKKECGDTCVLAGTCEGQACDPPCTGGKECTSGECVCPAGMKECFGGTEGNQCCNGIGCNTGEVAAMMLI
jgi:hypothetical protein